MMHSIRTSGAINIGLLLLLAARVAAQGTFTVDVTPTVVGRSGNVSSMRYVVRVLPGSTDSLSIFLVDAPRTTLRVVEPTPHASWTTAARFRRRPAASWILLDGLTTAGGSTPALEVSGAGVLDIVTYWAIPETPRVPGESDTPADTVTSNDTVVDFPSAVVGTTIGIVQPPDPSPSALATRLRMLIARTCALGWIDNSGVCNSLSGKAKPAAHSLQAMQHELDAQRGKHLSEQAYLLLTDNVTYLLASL